MWKLEQRLHAYPCKQPQHKPGTKGLGGFMVALDAAAATASQCKNHGTYYWKFSVFLGDRIISESGVKQLTLRWHRQHVIARSCYDTLMAKLLQVITSSRGWKKILGPNR